MQSISVIFNLLSLQDASRTPVLDTSWDASWTRNENIFSYPDVILESFDITDFKIFNISSEQEGSKVLTNSNFSLSFIFPDEIVNQKAIYLSYIPYNEAKKENENKREEISNCKIHTLSNSKN